MGMAVTVVTSSLHSSSVCLRRLLVARAPTSAPNTLSWPQMPEKLPARRGGLGAAAPHPQQAWRPVLLSP